MSYFTKPIIQLPVELTRDTDLPPISTLLYVYMLNYNHMANFYKSLMSISKDTGLNPQTIKKHMNILKDRGYITITYKPGFKFKEDDKFGITGKEFPYKYSIYKNEMILPEHHTFISSTILQMVIEKKLTYSAFKLYLYIKGRAFGQVALDNLKNHYGYETKYFIKPNHNKVYGEFRKVELPEKHIISNRHINRMLKELRDNQLVAKEDDYILSCYEPNFFVAFQRTQSNMKRRYRPYYYKTGFAGAKTGNNFLLLDNDVSLDSLPAQLVKFIQWFGSAVQSKFGHPLTIRPTDIANLSIIFNLDWSEIDNSLLDRLIQLVSNIISRSQFFRNSTHQLSVLKPYCNYICAGVNKKTLILKNGVSLDGLPSHVRKFIQRLSTLIFDKFYHPLVIRQSDVDNLPLIFDFDWKDWDDELVDIFLQHTQQNIFRSKYFKNSYHNLSVLKPYRHYLFKKYYKLHPMSDEEKELSDYDLLDMWEKDDIIFVNGKPFRVDWDEYEMEKWFHRNDPLPKDEDLDNYERQLLSELGYKTTTDKTPTLATVNKDPSPDPELDDFERQVLSEMDMEPIKEEKRVPDIFKDFNPWKRYEIQDCEVKYDMDELKTRLVDMKNKKDPLRRYENSKMGFELENLTIFFGS